MIVPACLGLLLAIGVLADARLARGLSLQWAAPWLRGEAPPLIAVAAAFVLASVLVALTLLRRWLPSAEHAPIVLLFLATQFVGFNLANIEPLKIALLITSGMWLADALTNDRPVRLYPPFLMMWLAILAFAFASVLNGLVISFVAQYSIVAKFLMFFIVANLVRTPSQLVFTVRLLVALGIASAVLAMAQEAVFYFWKIPLSLDDNAPKYWFKETPLGWMIRATAFHPTAQNLSHYLLIATSLLMLGPFSNRLRIVGGTLMGAGMFFTFTGNGLVVMSVLLLVTPIMLRPRLTIHYVAFLLLVGLIAYQTGVAEWVYEKYLLPISGKSAEDRIGLLQVGLEVMERHPFIGIGLNNFGRLSPQPVHNAYLQLATEIGLLPAALLCLILLGIFVRLVVGLRQTPPSDATKAGKGILLGLMGLALHFMFEPFINSLVSWSIIGLAEAAALLLYHSDERRADRRGTAHPALSTPP